MIRKSWFFNVLGDYEDFDKKFKEASTNNLGCLIEDVVYVNYTIKTDKDRDHRRMISGVIQFQEKKNWHDAFGWFPHFSGVNISETLKVPRRKILKKIMKIQEVMVNNQIGASDDVPCYVYGLVRSTCEIRIRSDSMMGRNIIHAMIAGESITYIHNQIPVKERHLVDYPELRKASVFYQHMCRHISEKNKNQPERFAFLNFF